MIGVVGAILVVALLGWLWRRLAMRSLHKRIRHALAMASVVLAQRAEYMLKPELAGEVSSANIAAGIANIASGSSRPDESELQTIRENADRIWSLADRLTEQCRFRVKS